MTSRWAETDVELRDGQSFAIAGLLDNISQDDAAAIPILSKLPIIGALFRSKAERREETELMVLITPRLVRPLNPDEVPPLPTSIRPFIKRGDLGGKLDGAGGVVDAPRKPAGGSKEKNSHACNDVSEDRAGATNEERCSSRWRSRCWRFSRCRRSSSITA